MSFSTICALSDRANKKKVLSGATKRRNEITTGEEEKEVELGSVLVCKPSVDSSAHSQRMILIQLLLLKTRRRLIFLILPSGLLMLLLIETVRTLLIQSSGLLLYIRIWFRGHVQPYLATCQFKV